MPPYQLPQNRLGGHERPPICRCLVPSAERQVLDADRLHALQEEHGGEAGRRDLVGDGPVINLDADGHGQLNLYQRPSAPLTCLFRDALADRPVR